MSEMRRGEIKRIALLRAAAELVMAKGIDAATTREIAERAQSTERTLFKQFGSKDGLITAMLDMVALGQLEQSLFARLSSDPPATLDAFEAWHRDLLAERVGSQATGSAVGRLFLLEIIQNESFKARYSPAWIERLWRPLVACLEALRSNGEIDRDSDAPFLARSFLSLNLGYVVTRLQVAPALPWRTSEDAAQIAAFFRRGIEPRR